MPDFAALSGGQGWKHKCMGFLVSFSDVLGVPGSGYDTRDASLGSRAPLTNLFSEHDAPLILSSQFLLNPETPKSFEFVLCRPQVQGVVVAFSHPSALCGAGGKVASGLADDTVCTQPVALSPDHSRSSKASAWSSSSEEKRAVGRSEHSTGASTKSLLPKESRLDAFWD